MTYQPFIDDPLHIRMLSGQCFVVLRAPAALSGAYVQIQQVLRERLHGKPVSFPAQAHVTLCGFASGTPLQAVQALVLGWATQASPLCLEVESITWFAPPFQIVVAEVRKTPVLFAALADLRARAEEQRLTVSTVIPVDAWRFHMSLAYCSALDEVAWRDVVQVAGTLRPPTGQGVVGAVEVAVFDDRREYSGGVFALGPRK